MPAPEDGSKGTDTPAIPQEVADQLAKFGEQVDNLNKAVKEARDDSKTSKTELAEFKTKYDELKQQLEKGVDKDDLDLSEEDLKKFKKFAESNGLVTKEELKKIEAESEKSTLAQVEQQAISELIEKHPEFEDDAEFAKLKEEFQLYKQPTNLTDYRKLLNRIVKDLKGDDKKEEGANETRAEIRRRERLGLGGKSPASDDKDSELNDLAKRYPNLSKDQLKERLAELNALYPDDKE